MTNSRIDSSCRQRSIILAAFSTGLLVGVVSSLLVVQIQQITHIFTEGTVITAVIGLYSVYFILLAPRTLSRLSRSFLRAYVVNIAFIVGLTVTITFRILENFIMPISLSVLCTLLLVATLATLISAAIAALPGAFITYRMTKWADPDQRPYCDACGYSLKGIDSERCPECAHPAGRASRPAAAYRLSAQVLACFLVLIVAIRLVALCLGPALMMERFMALPLDDGPGYSSGKTYLSQIDAIDGDATWRYMFIPGHTDKLLELLLPDEVSPDLGMQMRLAWNVDGFGIPVSGAPEIICNLTLTEAKALLNSGVPPSLIDAFLQAASDSQWVKNQPVYDPVNSSVRIQNPDGMPTGTIVIPAGPHFAGDAEP